MARRATSRSAGSRKAGRRKKPSAGGAWITVLIIFIGAAAMVVPFVMNAMKQKPAQQTQATYNDMQAPQLNRDGRRTHSREERPEKEYAKLKPWNGRLCNFVSVNS